MWKKAVFIVFINITNLRHPIYAANTAVLQEYYENHKEYRKPKIPVIENFDKSYDFIIIGSGSGGSVMANRLSEVSGWKILLLEAGDQADFLTDVPLIAGNIVGTKFDWNYTSVEQKHSCLNDKGVCFLPRGKVLGGCSLMNFIMYTRGNKRNYEDWCENDNFGWCYENVLTYFKKSEDVHIDYLKKSEYHGTKGFLSVEYPSFKSEISQTYLESRLEMGYGMNGDYNGEKQDGFSKVQANLKNGKRCSVVECYLQPASSRKNLDIATNSFVKRLLINEATKRTKGVVVNKNGIDFEIYAEKEVILSAGTINSPQILLLSGIGPKDHLENLNINVVNDLKVGYNYQDHLGIVALNFDIEGGDMINKNVLENEQIIKNYFENGAGPLTVPAGIEVFSYMHTKNANIDIPDAEIVLFTYTESLDNLRSTKFNKTYGRDRKFSKNRERLNDPLMKNENKNSILNKIRYFKGSNGKNYSLPCEDPALCRKNTPKSIRKTDDIIGKIGNENAKIFNKNNIKTKNYIHKMAISKAHVTNYDVGDKNGLENGKAENSDNNQKDHFALVAVYLYPKSLGKIELNSKYPEDHPRIDPNSYTHKNDIKGSIDVIKLAVKVARTKAFAKYNATLDPTPTPGCEDLVFESDEYWECAIRQVGSTLHHQVGTCKMGPASDPTAVVDHTLKVHGIKGLRVVDASIMPTIPAAHTNAVVYMIAEKAADMVKQEWLGENPKTKE